MNSKNFPIFEIRIPTYKRQLLLKRCLQSLVLQEYPHWYAVVIDDSPEQEGYKVAKSFSDNRIIYTPNLHNLGIVANLNQCFRMKKFHSSSTYASVLEDDNYYLSTFLKDSLEVFIRTGSKVVLSSSRIALLKKDESEILQNRFTLRSTYGEEERFITYQERLCKALSGFPATNLGLVWSFDDEVSLETDVEKYNPVVAEKLRGLVCKGDFYYNPQAASVLTVFEKKSTLELHKKTSESNRRFRRSQLSFNRLVYTEIVRLNLLEEIDKLSNQKKITLKLAESGSLKAILSLGSPADWIKLIKSIALWLLFPFQSNFSGFRSRHIAD